MYLVKEIEKGNFVQEKARLLGSEIKHVRCSFCTTTFDPHSLFPNFVTTLTHLLTSFVESEQAINRHILDLTNETQWEVIGKTYLRCKNMANGLILRSLAREDVFFFSQEFIGPMNV
ncbi:unnamed protein product [Vicia faba]|uniref:Uncharacterized protein n=1 Tax=Vicia faba TaxID=3906 RepID=A0AAV0ZTH0_VICFA|nr:unnamed protein product [Vicia faba]